MKIFFASDIHLGAPTIADHRAHERRFVQWLDAVGREADEIVLLGDVFDYWYEYRTVVPRGFTRFLGKLSELTDRGVKVHFFTGNHDVWAFDYLATECGVELHFGPQERTIGGKTFFLAHGDGLGSYDRPYNLMKSIFTSPVAQWFYSKLHPDIGGWIATHWSGSSRRRNNRSRRRFFMGEEREIPIRFARDVLADRPIDYFVVGHRHVAVDYRLTDTSRIIYLGEWIEQCTYAVFDGTDVSLLTYKD